MSWMPIQRVDTVEGERDKGDGSFRSAAEESLRRLQVSLAGVLGSLSPVDHPRRAADLQRILLVPAKLAWQIHRVANAGKPLAEATNVPGKAAMRRFLDAASKHGASPKWIDEVAAAYQRFDDLIQLHAGSRTAFDSMIDGFVAGGSDQIDLVHKRAAFKANSHIWGVQAQTQIACFALKPNPENPRRLDTFTIRGLIGLRRLRADAPWTISTTRLIDDKGNVQKSIGREPLDPRSDRDNPIGLIHAFCSQPVPKFRTIAKGSGYVNFELEGGNVGNLSTVTCMNGFIWRGVIPRYREENNRVARYSAKVRTPCESLILDVILHESAIQGIHPIVEVYSDHRGSDSESPDRHYDMLAMDERVARLGRGSHVLQSPDAPRYVEMAEYGFERMGWERDEFHTFRCHVRYPVMPSSVIMRYDLPEPPSDPIT